MVIRELLYDYQKTIKRLSVIKFTTLQFKKYSNISSIIINLFILFVNVNKLCTIKITQAIINVFLFSFFSKFGSIMEKIMN